MNVLAIISLVTGILWLSIAAIITGHIALSQIKKRGEGGQVLAIIGLVLGYLGSLGWIVFWIVSIAYWATLAQYSSIYGF
jgi:peptidyl-prolyl cis-trans isomerase B (cyclophilin B)